MDWIEAAGEDGTNIVVMLTAGARFESIGEISEGPDRQYLYLPVTVAAPAKDGKANQALIKLLAKTCGLPKGSFEIVTGKKSRMKTIHIQAPAQTLFRILGAGDDRQKELT